ncbi:DHS-like NAD/FAD-binding domain-containing protein [Cokeromyces recurvatus]|uniref:DHS-like NAD/FAD-binding domain-containing protein n=1 Tax=Cokeromyces recurvatus TaxID=90255 RepID=UPI00221FBA88|nr:DHS-like NAD/FAD-binding domain-containing protein [Cokeromyces recurvatus]KAI7904085.1 DHS-like NAD/FAD-binding domain-containing protein [Cokeromyces recurvatus]
MVYPTFVLKQASNKIWNSTIKIPELKTTLPASPPSFDQNEVVNLVTDMFRQYKGRILVITGAGISTDSGIPDYRGDQGTYIRNPKHRPILYHELASSHSYRQRYWSRSYLGWPSMFAALPNLSHHILKKLITEQPYVQNIITQNVDHLHSKLNTPKDRLLELHGTLYKVECMECGESSADRNLYQHRIHARNPTWGEFLLGNKEMKINPDGDVELPEGVSYHHFDIPPCLSCGSNKMKPKVVFFGESIKPNITHQAENWVEKADALLILGSSLATYSSYRLVRLAHQANKPIGIITKGPTRADNLMSWKGEVACTPILTELYSNLI